MDENKTETTQNTEAENLQPKAEAVQTEAEDLSQYRKLLVFSVNQRKFSVEAACVNEIINDIEVYPLPFVPPSVEGVINLRGQPVTVFNPFVDADFEGIKSLVHCNILKFNSEDEAFGIKISKVDSFLPENQTEGIEELKVEKLKADLRNALGYEND